MLHVRGQRDNNNGDRVLGVYPDNCHSSNSQILLLLVSELLRTKWNTISETIDTVEKLKIYTQETAPLSTDVWAIVHVLVAFLHEISTRDYEPRRKAFEDFVATVRDIYRQVRREDQRITCTQQDHETQRIIDDALHLTYAVATNSEWTRQNP